MCFSATASFTASAVLFLSGGYAILQAFRNDTRYLFLAFIPFIFGFQQAFEGMLWLNLQNPIWAYAYLFFAFQFWPIYLPFSIMNIENDPLRKKYLIILSLLGLFVGLVIYLPILFKITPLTVYPIHHSICYHVDLQTSKVLTLSTLYLMITALACFISSIKNIRFIGFFIIASFGFTLLFFQYAFTSVWCFFGTLISISIIGIILKYKD